MEQMPDTHEIEAKATEESKALLAEFDQLPCIADDDQARRAAEMLVMAETLSRKIQADMDPIVKATNAAHKQATELRARLQAPVKAASEKLRQLIGAYQAEKQRKAREEAERQQRLIQEAAERKAREEAEARRAEEERRAREEAERKRAEAERLEAERKARALEAEEAEAKRIAAEREIEEAKKAEDEWAIIEAECAREAAETEAAAARANEQQASAMAENCTAEAAALEQTAQQIAEAEPEPVEVMVPVVVTPEPALKLNGVSTRRVWDFRVERFGDVPDTFKIIDEAAVMAVVKRKGRDANIPGIVVFERETTSVRTK